MIHERRRIDCPRCRRHLTAGGGSPFRGVLRPFLHCDHCHIGLLDGTEATSMLGKRDLFSTTALRDRKDSGYDCPFCTYRRMEKLTLSWGARWVEVEQCEGCLGILLDQGERAKLGEILSSIPGWFK